LGAREVEIVDDNFNADLRRAAIILEDIAGRGRKTHLSLTNNLRPDHLSHEFLQACKSAGVYRIMYGLESASPRIQKLINQNLDLNLARANISRTVARRISTGGYFTLGFPQETLAEMRASVQWAVDSDLHTASFQILNPLPNTDIYRWAVEQGFDLSPASGEISRANVNLSQVPDAAIQNLRAEAFRRFYLRPDRVYRYLRDTPVNARLGQQLYASMRQALLGEVSA
jgi:radical SAM superfamily enzyme YgiQ (UPF0313 family)